MDSEWVETVIWQELLWPPVYYHIWCVVNLKKLEEAGYIEVRKEFVERKPVSSYKLLNKGKQAFELYIKKLEGLIKK